MNRGIRASRKFRRSFLSDAIMYITQKSMGFKNSFEPAATSTREVTGNGSLRINDIRYATDHPNSFLDIYIADNDATVKRPTFVYVHGGGFVVGDKTSGDPAAEGEDGFRIVSDPIIAAGYNLVSIDYSLAPKVKYPVPTVQLSQAISFLQDHGAEYGLDMSRFVISGGSAGGQIVGQFANIETNPVYSARIGIEAVTNDNLKAVVFDSALIEISRAARTQAPRPLTNVLFGLAELTYLGYSAASRAEADVFRYVTRDFPPAFIADGNTGTFPDQARDLHHKLDDLGVENAVILPPRRDVVLGHGFMASPSAWTTEYNRRKISFLDRILGRSQ